MTNIWVMLYYTALGATLFLLLLERRFSLGKTCAIVYGVTLLLMVMDFWIDRLLGFDWLVRLYAPLNHVPIALTMAFVSRNRGWHLVFQLLSTVMLAMLLQHVSALVFLLSGRRSGALLLTYAVLTALLVPYVRYFLRPLYLRIFRQLRRGWGLICLVLAAYYAIVIYLVPGYAGETMWATMFKSAISLLIVGFFSVVLFLFSSIQRETEARHSAELAALQIAGLRSRMDAVREAEEVVRLERHDLRHRLYTAAELVRQGRTEEALSLIGAAQARLEESRPVRWCRPPVLDAVFSACFCQAGRQGIRVEAELTLDETLPVDEAELAMVFANALENAIHACQALPEGERVLRCKAISRPGLMLEVANPCAGPVDFDGEGLPRSEKTGHGLGSRSIRAFCQKHGALCRFEYRDGWFTLRIIF